MEPAGDRVGRYAAASLAGSTIVPVLLQLYEAREQVQIFQANDCCRLTRRSVD